jgi:predicted amidohydrolase YtcJ
MQKILLIIMVTTTLWACREGTIEIPGDESSVATTLYMNGDIITLNNADPHAEAVAVQDGRIVAVGDLAKIQSTFSDNVSQVDLNGATLIPGLIDAHGHLSFAAVAASSANVASPPVGPAENVRDVVEILRSHAKNVPGNGWILGFGYDDSLLEEQRHPTRTDLDLVAKDRPVAIIHVSAHLMSCNSKCLEIAGIDASTPNPEGGVIRRLPDSTEPDGVLEETAMHALLKILPQPDSEMRLRMLDRALDYYASYGITTVQDGAAQPQEIQILRQAAANGQLKLDVVAFPYVAFIDDQLNDVAVNKQYDNGFRVGGIKLLLDGSPQGKTAWLSQPYFIPPPGHDESYLGYPIMQDEKVVDLIGRAFTKQIPVLAHANGDAAIGQLIAAVSKVNEEQGNLDRRTVMIHAQTAREDQIDAMLEQNIMPSYFSAHTFYWGDWHRDSVFGEARAQRISPLQSSIKKGLRFTTHNDTPVVPPDMMRLLWASVNRVTRSGKILGEAQQISTLEALKSITINAAYQYFEEDSKGSIEVGKLADFTILDQNPLKVDPFTIKDIQVLQTIKQGQTVYSKGDD